MLQKFKISFSFFFVVLTVVLLFASVALAQDIAPPGFEQTVNLSKTSVILIIARIINVALSFLGIVAVLLILYGGFLWMTSAGNEEKIAQAKKLLIDAGIGLFIILSSFVLAQFIFSKFGAGGEGVPIAASPALIARVGGGALGGGIVQDHYPARGQTEVPRNTKIVVTFKEAINPGSLVNVPENAAQGGASEIIYKEVDGNKIPVPGLTLREDAIQIIKTADISNSARESDKDKYIKPAGISFTSDLRTWVLTMPTLLGNETESVSYTVYLCGGKNPKGNCGGGLKLSSGDNAFSGIFSDYQWSFETGTKLDLSPPTIVGTQPAPDNLADGSDNLVKDRKDKPRNSIVQVNFSEPILPMVASGQVSLIGGSTAALAVLEKTDGKVITGAWQVGNGYRTSEFISDDRCGRNACGQDVFCLPGPAEIGVAARAAGLAGGQGFQSAGLLDGLEDLAGNSLDGNQDGQAKGPSGIYDLNKQEGSGDSVAWSFWTKSYIDLTSPMVDDNSPYIQESGVGLTKPVEIIFNKPMSLVSFNSKNINLSGQEEATAKPWDTWWRAGGENLGDDAAPGKEAEKSKAIINHGGLWEISSYQTQANQDVKDIYQNCFFPASAKKVCGNLSQDEPYCCNGVPSDEPCF
ncbi:MAG: hypothetical protein Q8M83_06080 [bacterium]|nr:hypothetical protein [bacterium]